MTAEEILTLVKAGYTKTEISAMGADQGGSGAAAAPVQEGNKPEAAAQAVKPETPALTGVQGEEVPQASPAPEKPAQEDVIAKLMEQNNKMLETIKQIQSDNAKAAQQPEDAGKKTAATIITDFISKL